jgi:pimeloyl-ACP methyl ester carboxylesterase
MKLLVDGREAWAYTGGKPFDAALPCVVFIHGALQDHSGWTLLARWFAHHGRSVLALDLPAHGRSAGPALADVESLADWVLACTDAAGARAPAFVGHSLGALVALEAAARAADRATDLVMIGATFPMKVSEALLSASREAPPKAIDMVTAWSHSTIAAKPSFPGPGAWLHGASRQLMRRMQSLDDRSNLFHHDFNVCDRYARGLEAAKAVRCPAGLIVGDRDQMTPPRAAGALADALSARVCTLRGGHALVQESPDAVLKALRSLVE